MVRGSANSPFRKFLETVLSELNVPSKLFEIVLND